MQATQGKPRDRPADFRSPFLPSLILDRYAVAKDADFDQAARAIQSGKKSNIYSVPKAAAVQPSGKRKADGEATSAKGHDSKKSRKQKK